MSELVPAPELTDADRCCGLVRAGVPRRHLPGPLTTTARWAVTGRYALLAANAREVPGILQVLPEAVVHVGDVTDVGVLDALFRGAAGASVVHAAGVIHPLRATEFARVNHRGTVAVLEAASRAQAGQPSAPLVQLPLRHERLSR